MMNYKVGDKVRIRRDLSEGVFVSKQMISHSGEVATITKVLGASEYVIDIDNEAWVWAGSMLEDVDSERHKMNKRVVIEVEEDKIVARCGDKEGAVRCRPGKDFYAGARIALERLKESDKPYGWLKEGVRCYSPSIISDKLYNVSTYYADSCDRRIVKRGLAFQTKEEAITCAKRMLESIKKEG